jgi:molecular chaperone DnaK (HSP70)
MFQEIIPEYTVESEDAMDEGIAVLYNTIADQIEKNRFSDGREYKALIIDCGGGTTDLSSCSFSIEEATYHIKYI